MNTVFQVTNVLDHDIVVSADVGFSATVEPGASLDINFPSDVHKVISVQIGAVPADEPAEAAEKRARIYRPTPMPPMVEIEPVIAPPVKVAKPPSP